MIDGDADDGRLLWRVGVGVGDRISMEEYDTGISILDGTGLDMAESYDLMDPAECVLVGGADDGRFFRVGDGVGTGVLRPDVCFVSSIGFLDKLRCCSNFDLEVDLSARFASIRSTASLAHC